MDRSRAVSNTERRRVRIAWLDGAFSLECSGEVGRMRLRVIQSGELLAEEPVASAEQAYQRGREIVLALREGRPDYREGSA